MSSFGSGESYDGDAFDEDDDNDSDDGLSFTMNRDDSTLNEDDDHDSDDDLSFTMNSDDGTLNEGDDHDSDDDLSFTMNSDDGTLNEGDDHDSDDDLSFTINSDDGTLNEDGDHDSDDGLSFTMNSDDGTLNEDDDHDSDDDYSEDDQSYSRHDYDAYYDYDSHEDDRVSSLIDSLLAEVPMASLRTRLISIVDNSSIRSSVRGVGFSHGMPSPPVSIYGDFIDSFLAVPMVDRGITTTAPLYLSNGLVKEAVGSKRTSASKLFVGNIPLTVTWEELKRFFNKSDYTVKNIQLPPSRVCIDLDWHPSFLCYCYFPIVFREKQNMHLFNSFRTPSVKRY